MRYRASYINVLGKVFLSPGEDLATRTEKAGKRKPEKNEEF
jgi:hypothetical protein